MKIALALLFTTALATSAFAADQTQTVFTPRPVR